MARDAVYGRFGKRTSVLGTKTSVFGTKTSVLGSRTSVFGSRTSIFGPRTSVLGPRTSVLGPRARESGPRARESGPRHGNLVLGTGICSSARLCSRALPLGAVLGTYSPLRQYDGPSAHCTPAGQHAPYCPTPWCTAACLPLFVHELRIIDV